MSNKTRARRGVTATKSPAVDPDMALDRLLSVVWAAISAGEPLQAELQTAVCMAVPRMGRVEAGTVDDFSARVLVNAAIDRWGPEGTALLRLLMALGSPRVKRAAGAALAEMTRVGIYPPEWVNSIGKAVPVGAMRRYHASGDGEAIAVTFRYGEGEHGIGVQVDLRDVPVATQVVVTYHPARLMETLSREDSPDEHSEPIGLAEARRRLEDPLARCGQDPDRELSLETLAGLPIARSRIRRLPGTDELPRAPPLYRHELRTRERHFPVLRRARLGSGHAAHRPARRAARRRDVRPDPARPGLRPPGHPG
jgi:hypothetical protein